MAGRDTLVRLARQGEALGHVINLVEPVPGKFRAACSCGYSSTNRRAQALALSAGFHHLGQVAGESSRNGRPPTTAVVDEHQLHGDTPKITNPSRNVRAHL